MGFKLTCISVILGLIKFGSFFSLDFNIFNGLLYMLFKILKMIVLFSLLNYNIKR